MKKWTIITGLVLFLAAGLWTAKHTAEAAARAVLAEQTRETVTAQAAVTVPEPTAAPEMAEPAVPTTQAPTVPSTEAPTESVPEQVLFFTEEEEQLLLQIGAAERGQSGCTECIALVMRTVLNRVESTKFSSTIKGVIYAQDQFTPVMDGTFEEAVPGWRCREALDWIKTGWDESQGALYYEWCEGESWHSRNLNLLFQHCDTRFYN